MNIEVHNQILFYACQKALANNPNIKNPLPYFPLMVRGSWMNDTNQATIFTEQIEKATSAHVEQKAQEFFCAYWNADKVKLLGQMAKGPQAAQDSVAEAKKHLKKIPGGKTDDFGLYDRYDHLDILFDTDATLEKQYWDTDVLGRADTVAEACDRVVDRIHTAVSAGTDHRYTWSKMNMLGRALHTIQDVFAHTNYVELLLWAMSQRCKLPAYIVDEFNGPVNFIKGAPYEECFCPLPPEDKDIHKAMTAKNTMFWYGPTPDATPFVSALFDTSDTAVSLLEMYAVNLMKLDSKKHAKKTMNMVLSVFQVPGEPVVGWIWDKAIDFHYWLDKQGKKARRWLAKKLQAKANDLGAAAKSAALIGARILRQYDSTEAKDWARAGRLRYLAHAMMRDMATELFAKNAREFRLPHHSLIRKDYYPKRFDDILRYRLACILATDLTSQIIGNYFSDHPDVDVIEDHIEKLIRHPWKLFDGTNAAGTAMCKKMLRTVDLAAGRSWTRLLVE
jgi:hypothetical protein